MDEHELIKSDICAWMKENALGRENAKPRRLLLHHLRQERFRAVSDRTLRRMYAGLAVGYSCENPRGIFWISNSVDLEALRSGQRTKAIGCFSRVKTVEAAVKGPGPQQLELGV